MSLPMVRGTSIETEDEMTRRPTAAVRVLRSGIASSTSLPTDDSALPSSACISSLLLSANAEVKRAKGDLRTAATSVGASDSAFGATLTSASFGGRADEEFRRIPHRRPVLVIGRHGVAGDAWRRDHWDDVCRRRAGAFRTSAHRTIRTFPQWLRLTSNRGTLDEARCERCARRKAQTKAHYEASVGHA